MMKTWVGCLALVLAVAPGQADDKKPPASKAPPKAKPPGKDFYRVLVKAGSKWVLKTENATKDSKEKIVVEVYDARKVGDADVARLRWTHYDFEGKAEDIGATDQGKFTQLAVTDKGLYLLNAKNDDAVVAQRIKGKPSRSSPPKEYEGTKKNGGRYLSINPMSGVVCMGEANLSGQCEDTCDGYVCVAEGSGIVELSGTYAPGLDSYVQK